MKRFFKSPVVTCTLLALVGCKPMGSDQTSSDVQFVMEKGNPTKAIVGFSLVKATNKDPQKSIKELRTYSVVSSCGYEIELNKPDKTVFQPLNKFAFDSRWGEIKGKSEYYGGAVVAVSGFVLGVILVGGSTAAAATLAPPALYGIGPGLALIGSSGLVGGTIGASGENKLQENREAAGTFRDIIERKKNETTHFYQYKIEQIKKSGNTSKKCPEMTLGDLKVIGGLRAGNPK